MSIYKPCDIRGQVATELSPFLYERWGRTLARRLGAGKPIVAGGDVRGSTPAFLAALIDGLQRGGAEVIDLGLLPTPMIYHARRLLGAEGCAIVTASHNPSSVNGLKWMLGNAAPTPEDVALLERGAQETPGGEGDGAPGTRRAVDCSREYIAWLRESFPGSATAQMQVVLDPMYGSWAGRAEGYLKAVFPGCSFASIRDTPDSEFGHGTPDPSQPRHLGELCAAVSHRRAGLGLAFDGDGDRIGLVDQQGVPLRAEEAVWVLLHSFEREMAGSGFVYDLKFSDRVPEAARQLGAEPLVERSGHAFLRRRMQETGSLFGAEISGHYFYRALDGGDDALYTACRVIDYLARCNRSLADLRSDCPPVHISPDLRVALSPERQAALVSRIREEWARYPQKSIDGVRIDTPDGWALVRSSVTEPALTFRFEGRDQAALHSLVERFCASLPEIGDELRRKFTQALPG